MADARKQKKYLSRENNKKTEKREGGCEGGDIAIVSEKGRKINIFPYIHICAHIQSSLVKWKKKIRKRKK